MNNDLSKVSMIASIISFMAVAGAIETLPFDASFLSYITIATVTAAAIALGFVSLCFQDN